MVIPYADMGQRSQYAVSLAFYSQTSALVAAEAEGRRQAAVNPNASHDEAGDCGGSGIRVAGSCYDGGWPRGAC